MRDAAASLYPTWEYDTVGFWKSLWLVLRGWRIEVYRRV